MIGKKKKNPGKFQAFFISNKTCKIVNNWNLSYIQSNFKSDEQKWSKQKQISLTCNNSLLR